MSWLLSLIVAGTVFTSGLNLPDLHYRQNTVSGSENASVVTLDETERFEKSYPFDKNGTVEISNINGAIQIDSWDRNEIKFEYVKIADSKERLADLDVLIEATSSTFKVSTDYRKANNRVKSEKNCCQLSVDFKLTVPKTVRLDAIESINGSVVLSNMTNFSEVTAVNGTVKATNLRGTADLSTVNGTVYADFDELDKDASISLETVNGSVKLFIPSNSNATLKAETTNGSISNDFLLPVRKGKYVGKDLHGKIGSGNVQINLSSVNGGLSINRKQDGKTLSPSTNLLQMRNDDDDIEIEIGKIDSERARETARVAMTEAMKEAARVRREYVIPKPEVERIDREALKEAEKALNEIKIEGFRVDKDTLQQSLLDAEKIREEALKNMSDAFFTRSAPFVQEKTETFEVKGIPTVKIEALNCAITVKGWEQNKVKYSLSRVKRGMAQSPVQVETANGESIQIKVKTSSGLQTDDADEGVRLEVFVPKKSNLEIHTHRELRVEGISGDIDLDSDDSSVNLRDLQGTLKLTISNKYKNNLRIVGFKGEFTADVLNADTYLEGDFTNIRLNGKGSDIYLTLPENADATIESNSLSVGRKVVPGAKFNIDGIQVFSEDSNTWRVGEGAARFSFDLSNGMTFIRSKGSLMGR